MINFYVGQEYKQIKKEMKALQDYFAEAIAKRGENVSQASTFRHIVHMLYAELNHRKKEGEQ